MPNITVDVALSVAPKQVVVLGGSSRAVAAAQSLAGRWSVKRVTLIAGTAALPAETVRRLVRVGVGVVSDDPWLEIAPDADEGGGVVATESGRTFEFDALFQFPEIDDGATGGLG